MPERSLWGRAVAALVVAAVLAGCALQRSNRLSAGMTESEVVAAMGPPTGRYAMPGGGSRLEYATGYMGRETWMVDLDTGGRATRWLQVLDPFYFNQITDGMSTDELLLNLGRPGDVQGARGGQQLWYWRYPNNDCLIAVAQLSAEGRVKGGVSTMPDMRCERGGR